MRLVFIVLVLMFSALAGAQETIIARTFDATNFIETLQTEAETYNETLTEIGRVLAVLGMVASVVMGLVKGSLHATAETFLRLLVVAALLFLTPSISDLTYNTWDSTRNWSMDRLQGTFNESGAELEQLGVDSALLLTFVSAPTVAGATLTKGATVAARKGSQEMAKNLNRWANMAIIPVAFFVIIVHLVILLTGLTIAIINLVLPIAIGMLMFSPANGERWLGNYVGSAVTAILVVALMPLGFKAAFDLAIVEPVRTVNANFASFADIREQLVGDAPPVRVQEIEGEKEGLNRRLSELAEVAANNGEKHTEAWMNPQTRDEYGEVLDKIAALDAESKGVKEKWYEKVSREFTGALTGALAEMRNWALRLFLLLIGASFGSYMLWHVSRAVSGAVGGMALSGIQIATSPLKAISGKGGGGGGGGGGSSPKAVSNTGTEGRKPSGGDRAIGAGPNTGSGGRRRSEPEF